MLYENFNEWILDTIETIKPIKNVNWLIKIHPAESWLNPENGIRALISKYYPVLPDHIRIIDADININPYNFFEIIDGAITVFGTSGMELAYLGKPVILAGSVNYFNNGFTYDPKTIEEYRAFLKKVEEIPPLNSTQKSLAEKYAFIYWIRRQIPFAPVYSKYLKFWKYEHCKRNLLLPGKDPYVEFLMDRILDGKEFIMSDKMLDLDKLEL
jgi:capsule polysaccharide modification protein KpsS